MKTESLKAEDLIAGLKRELDDTRALYTETERRLAQVQSPMVVQELQQEIADLHNACDDLKESLDERDQRIAELRAEVERLTARNNEIMGELAGLRAEHPEALALLRAWCAAIEEGDREAPHKETRALLRKDGE